MTAAQTHGTGPLLFQSDEDRATEGIAALLILRPRDSEADDEALAWEMADWALLQGPTVRWDAMLHVARAIIAALNEYGDYFDYPDLASIGYAARDEFDYHYAGGPRR